jgi:hypothetical protein
MVGVGLLVGVAPVMSASIACVVMALFATLALATRFGCLPRRPVDVVLAACVVLMPVLPAIQAFLGVGTILRYGLMLALLGCVIAYRSERCRPLLARGRWLFALFAMYQIVVFAESPNASLAAIRLANWVMFIPVVALRWDPARLRVLAGAVAVAGTLLAAGVLLQFEGILKFTWGGQVLSVGYGVPDVYSVRYTSFVFNPNDLGLAMAAVLIVSVLIAQVRTIGAKGRAILLTVGAGAGTGLVLSGSRGPLLGIPVAGVFLLLARRSDVLARLAIVGVAAVVVVFAAAPKVRESVVANLGSVAEVIRFEGISVDDRLTLWSTRFGDSTAPVIGAGYGGYLGVGSLSILESSARTDVYRAATIDNAFLKLWIEEGVIGVVLFVALIAVALVRLVRIARRDRLDPLGPIVGAVLVLVIFRALSADILDISPWNFYLWVILSIGFASDTLSRDGREEGAICGERPAPGALIGDKPALQGRRRRVRRSGRDSQRPMIW